MSKNEKFTLTQEDAKIRHGCNLTRLAASLVFRGGPPIRLERGAQGVCLRWPNASNQLRFQALETLTRNVSEFTSVFGKAHELLTTVFRMCSMVTMSLAINSFNAC